MTALQEMLRDFAVAIGLMPAQLQKIIDEETKIFEQPVSVTDRETIPPTSQIPIVNVSHWLRIPDVIACFVDMAGSTKLSASVHPKTTAKAYRYFTNTAIRIFHEFDAPYIDVKGDGVFALFNKGSSHRALAAVVTFKTFVANDFTPKVKKATDLEIGGHFGIDQKTVMVRKLGLKIFEDRTDRQNEVWAGKPVNMAAKLASLSSDNCLLISERFHKGLWGERALMSCGCPSGQSSPLWEETDLTDDDRFDFDTAYKLRSTWCATHGLDYCKSIAKYDDEPARK